MRKNLLRIIRIQCQQCLARNDNDLKTLYCPLLSEFAHYNLLTGKTRARFPGAAKTSLCLLLKRTATLDAALHSLLAQAGCKTLEGKPAYKGNNGLLKALKEKQNLTYLAALSFYF